MTISGKRRMTAKAAELYDIITTHHFDHGGTATLLLSPPGSGKTTALIRMAKDVCYVDTDGNKKLETVIWRGREFDYFPAIDPSGLVLHINMSDYKDKRIKFYDDNHHPYDITKFKIRLYDTIPHLNDNIEEHKINWVYPPSSYTVSKQLKKILNKSGMKDDDIGPEEFRDNSLWWFELWYYMSHYKKINFLSIFFDEAQQIMPVSPSGLHWHINQYLFKFLFADARKRNISVYMACHGHNEIDGRMVKNKIPYRIYFMGATPVYDSMVWKNAPKTELAGKGDCFIEGPSGWGVGHFQKLPKTDIVIVDTGHETVDHHYSDEEGI